MLGILTAFLYVRMNLRDVERHSHLAAAEMHDLSLMVILPDAGCFCLSDFGEPATEV